MARLDQVQRWMGHKGFCRAVSYHLGYDLLVWISKDTDMQAEHWEHHAITWEVPTTPFDFDAWTKDIADKMKLEEAYELFNPILEPDAKGKVMFYDYHIQPDSSVPSGFTVRFTYTYIDPELALM